ncbi:MULTISPECIES: MauE/DoxX family redox-associated membrane protein [Sphingobacterium]|uniref:MauE/DoxX family redox-associated membrane protein n=1 Tax=Sphingobacterium TaxID=28453 RepID=UPI0013D94AF8|nr:MULTISPECIES: MauE/DoxX family redox-associated membrane protein [unclassified Sphingobacterium]
MNKINRHTILNGIRLFLLLFWLYVAMDKLWDWALFHEALVKQPFPDWWADLLAWGLPAVELLIFLLFLGRPLKIEKILIRRAYQLSSVLLILFTVYIGLGVIGLYAEKPCGCASIFAGVPWAWHLLINLMLLALSLAGALLTKSSGAAGAPNAYKRPVKLFLLYIRQIAVAVFLLLIIRFNVFKRRFALFPGRPVWG